MLSGVHDSPAMDTDSYMREILNIFRPTWMRPMRAWRRPAGAMDENGAHLP